MLVVDRAGRRPLVLGSSAAVSAAIFALALCFAVKGSPGASRSAQEAGREGGRGRKGVVSWVRVQGSRLRVRTFDGGSTDE